ncbi:DUF6233 domain-containing protein [Streptomyces olivochromogenes]|uniref:DUF6233 domain-containing protein n=1 Tax=Streptomyces olivochromogenes TaxID=1963 RepID=UPI0036DEFB28
MHGLNGEKAAQRAEHPVCDCYAAGKRRRPAPRDEAHRLLTSGVRACTHCKPDPHLRTLD